MNRITWIGLGIIGVGIGICAFAIVHADELHVRSSLPYFNPNHERKETRMTEKECTDAEEKCRQFRSLFQEERRLTHIVDGLSEDLKINPASTEMILVRQQDFWVPSKFVLDVARERLNAVRWRLESMKLVAPAPPES